MQHYCLVLGNHACQIELERCRGPKVARDWTVGIHANDWIQVLHCSGLFEFKRVPEEGAVERVENGLALVINAAANGVIGAKTRAVLLDHASGRVENAAVVPVVAKGVSVPSRHARVQAKRIGRQSDRDALGCRRRALLFAIIESVMVLMLMILMKARSLMLLHQRKIGGSRQY